jgi:hypothetical protein
MFSFSIVEFTTKLSGKAIVYFVSKNSHQTPWAKARSSEKFSSLPCRFAIKTSTSPQNSQMICRHAPHGGVSASVSADDADFCEFFFARADRFKDRHALGAHRQTV